MNQTTQPSLSFISRAKHSDMMSLLYNTRLFHRPQEMGLLSSGEEVAWRRPQTDGTDGDCGKLLIISNKWKTHTRVVAVHLEKLWSKGTEEYCERCPSTLSIKYNFSVRKL